MVSPVKKVNRLKLQLEVKWFLAIFIVTIITILILSRVITIALSRLYQTVAETSSQNVAIQLASLMSAAGSVVNRIEIEYVPSNEILYDIKVDNRGKEVEVKAKFPQIYIEKITSEAKFCTSFDSQEVQDVNKFVIEKYEENGKVYYRLLARRISK